MLVGRHTQCPSVSSLLVSFINALFVHSTVLTRLIDNIKAATSSDSTWESMQSTMGIIVLEKAALAPPDDDQEVLDDAVMPVTNMEAHKTQRSKAQIFVKSTKVLPRSGNIQEKLQT